LSASKVNRCIHDAIAGIVEMGNDMQDFQGTIDPTQTLSAADNAG
jgi:hypothetical protein